MLKNVILTIGLFISIVNGLEVVIKFNQTISNDTLTQLNFTYNLILRKKFLNDFYLFNHEIHKKTKRSTQNTTLNFLNSILKNQPNITWFEIQKYLVRIKRNFIPDFLLDYAQSSEEIVYDDESGHHHHHPNLESESLEHDHFHVRNKKKIVNNNLRCNASSVHFNDPQWPLQWYLNDGCEQGFFLNITKAWSLGFTGKGVILSIIDDGLEKDNFEIIDNYDPRASFDLNDFDDDPQPRYDPNNENKHGTRCAGEIVAKLNNSFCGVGVAFNSKIGGIRLLDGRITDRLEAEALTFNLNYIDIFSASWGPLDDGKTVEGPGYLSKKAFDNGIKYGRNGKGTIYVWAAGNGGRFDDNCNCDGYTSSIYTITIGSINQDGEMTVYSEKCSAILASTFSSGKLHQRGIITSDLHNTCTHRHTGTSASAPIGAGIIALALEANKNLTWRDIQYLIIKTSKPYKMNLRDWSRNGKGNFFSHKFGYGLMNAGLMVELALKWINIGEQLKCTNIFQNFQDFLPMSIRRKSMRIFQLDCYECKNLNYLEHVLAKVSLHSGTRGKLRINLISPMGTKSNLLDFRKRDLSREGFKSWPFMSVHFWGENPKGVWKLEVINNSYHDVYFTEWKLIMYGVEYVPKIFFE
ncbi:unnamed protein product [Brachionus calyciflorus]|uniref:P/Homo B domain-containing protein n=1 Tax=Brachionus calyciflorus TaxID=104777 RepID=A0A813MD61_9BILA|nr:unnamed protein product [Brachionus calyciflorus]